MTMQLIKRWKVSYYHEGSLLGHLEIDNNNYKEVLQITSQIGMGIRVDRIIIEKVVG